MNCINEKPLLLEMAKAKIPYGKMIDADALLNFLIPILQENEKARMNCNNIQFISYDVKVNIIKKVITEIENLLKNHTE